MWLISIGKICIQYWFITIKNILLDRYQDGAEVHGVAFLTDDESVAELDKSEGGYNKAMVTMRAYDGRELEGFVYVPKTERREEFPPSSRYLGVLCKGARQAGLKTEYIKKLESLPTYSSHDNPEVMRARKERANIMDNLREITIKELSSHKFEDPWVCCLGFVMKQNSGLWRHRGRDITTRVLMQYHGIALDDNDDGGRPPYPLVSSLSPGELEYVTSWLDHYHIGSTGFLEEDSNIVGFLKEFRMQQLTQETAFILPPIPQ